MSSRSLTISVSVSREGIVLETAPIARWAIGKHVNRLRDWMERQGGYTETWRAHGYTTTHWQESPPGASKESESSP